MTATRVRMTVDVSLCGSIPRSHMPHLPSLPRSSVSCRSQALSREPPSLPRFLSTVKPSAFSRTEQSCTSAESGSSSRQQHGSSHQQHHQTIEAQPQSHRVESSLSREKMISLAASSLQQQSNGCNLVQQGQHSLTPIEPPSWAVAAKGESKLEPVCEAADRQTSVDLTARVVFSIGRSPSCNIQLFHETSSRRHAILFHHPNGSCYIADCGSAHGTYINGVRINGNSSGRVIPHRLKRGAMVRFGGPGSPSYVHKSFSTSFDSLARDVTGHAVEMKVFEERSTDTMNGASDTPTLAPSKATRLMLNTSTQDASISGLVKLNTRMNALGGPSALKDSNLSAAKKALDQFSVSKNTELQQLIKQCPSVLKRSFEQLDQNQQLQKSTAKRRRVFASQPVIELNAEDPILPFVSPSRSSSIQPLDIRFSVNTVLGSSSTIAISPVNEDSTPNPYFNVSCRTFSFSDSLTDLSPPETKKSKKVHFSDEKPELFYPPSVTPDFSSDDEDDTNADRCNTRVSLNPLAPRTPRA